MNPKLGEVKPDDDEADCGNSSEDKSGSINSSVLAFENDEMSEELPKKIAAAGNGRIKVDLGRISNNR